MYTNHPHYGQGYRYCSQCGHMVNPRFGGCRTCMTPLAELLVFDTVLARPYDYGFGNGYDFGGVGFDPVDDSIAFDIGGGLAIEPDGQLDEVTPFGDIPVQDDPFGVLQDNDYGYDNSGNSDSGNYGGGDF